MSPIGIEEGESPAHGTLIFIEYFEMEDAVRLITCGWRWLLILRDGIGRHDEQCPNDCVEWCAGCDLLQHDRLHCD